MHVSHLSKINHAPFLRYITSSHCIPLYLLYYNRTPLFLYPYQIVHCKTVTQSLRNRLGNSLRNTTRLPHFHLRIKWNSRYYLYRPTSNPHNGCNVNFLFYFTSLRNILRNTYIAQFTTYFRVRVTNHQDRRQIPRDRTRDLTRVLS